jgi:hypothetical protein
VLEGNNKQKLRCLGTDLKETENGIPCNRTKQVWRTSRKMRKNRDNIMILLAIDERVCWISSGISRRKQEDDNGGQ